MNEVEIHVDTKYEIDNDGTAVITDTKSVRNITNMEQSLSGPFKQGIRNPFKDIEVLDSDGNVLRHHEQQNEETSEIELFFAPTGDKFVIPAQSKKSFTVKYKAIQYAEKIGQGLLIKAHAGNVRYTPDRFDHFAFDHVYIIDLEKGKSLLTQWFNRYEVHALGFKPEIERSGNKFTIHASGVLTRKEVQTNVIFIEAKFRKWLAVTLSAIAGALVKIVLEHIIQFLAS